MQLSARSFVRRCLTWLLPAIALAPIPASAQTATAEQVTAVLAKLEQLAEATVANGGVPALAIGVVHDDKVVFLKGFGVREAGKPEKVDADTVFQIASMSKPISATVVAALVSDGIVSWDSKISDLDPAFRLAEPYPRASSPSATCLPIAAGFPAPPATISKTSATTAPKSCAASGSYRRRRASAPAIPTAISA
jgi:CubicO group peptidase (beta-lactamase class C family)